MLGQCWDVVPKAGEMGYFDVAVFATGATTGGGPTRHVSLVCGLPLTADRMLTATQEAAN